MTRRWLTAATWPVGVSLTAWDYMWRSTPLHRSERADVNVPEPPLALPEGVSREDVQGHEDGYGPLFHRRYRTRIANPKLRAHELMAEVQSNPNRPAPTFRALSEGVWRAECARRRR